MPLAIDTPRTVQVLDTSTTEVLATMEREGKGVKGDEAVAAELAATEAADLVANDVIAALRD